MRTFGTLSLRDTLVYGVNMLLYVMILIFMSGFFYISGIELGEIEGRLYTAMSLTSYLLSATILVGGSIGLQLKIVADAISIGLTMNDKSKNPFFSKGFGKPKPPMAVAKKNSTSGSDIEKAKSLFPQWDEQTIREYFEQGWSIQQLEDWVRENN